MSDAAPRPPVSGPWLPPGREVRLPRRGTTFVRELGGPPGAPTVLLLHGWTASADLNWFPAYRPLSRHFHVLAVDHRGHGRGIRSARPFRLEACADDAAALVRELGVGPVIAVGYSMGGPVAQLLWRRHPDLVRGLVLCATSRNFGQSPRARAMFSAMLGLGAAARLTPAGMRARLMRRVLGSRIPDSPMGRWISDELQRADPAALMEAGWAIGRFNSAGWIGDIDVPASVVVTTRDSIVPPHRQARLAESIPRATVHAVDGDHAVCVMQPQRFVPVLVDACRDVSSRALVPR